MEMNRIPKRFVRRMGKLSERAGQRLRTGPAEWSGAGKGAGLVPALFLVFLVSLVSLGSGCSSVPEAPGAPELEDSRVESLLAELDRLIYQPGEAQAQIREFYQEVRSRIVSGELAVRVEDFPHSSQVDAGRFVPLEDQGEAEEPEGPDAKIVLAPELFELPRGEVCRESSILLSTAVMELREASVYFSDPDRYRQAGESSLRMELDLMDARRQQALFINGILLEEGCTVTELESFLAESLQQGDMASFGRLFRGIELEMLESMAGFRRDLLAIAQQEDLPPGERAEKVHVVLNALQAKAEKILEEFSFPEEADRMEQYQAVIPGATFLAFVQELQMEAWQLLDSLPEEIRGEAVEPYRELDYTVTELSGRIFPHMDLYVDSFQSVIAHYGGWPSAEEAAGEGGDQ